MLTNVSQEPLTLLWNGAETVLRPGQTCRYLDPRVETRMKAKFGPALTHAPDAPKAANADATVTVGPAPEAPTAEPTPEPTPAKRGRPSKT